MATDAELLRHYANARSEDAFSELVRRHVNLVYAAALRQLGGDAHAAEDVTQAVFTDLAQKARLLAGREVIASWLYTSTRFAAANLRRARGRRHKHETEAELMRAIESTPATEWEKLRPLVDDVMHELNERERGAVVLRFFEGRAFAEIGEAYGLSEDAARMRVERALEKLRTLLARRGVSSTSAALSIALTSEVVVAAPAGLAASVTSAAMSGGAAAVTGAGSLAAAVYFMSASKITLSIAAAGVLAVGFTIYQSIEAGEIARDVDRTHSEMATLNARLATLESAVQTAEQDWAKADAELERIRAKKTAAASTAKARPAAAELQRKQQAKALQEFLDRDPELLKLRYDATVAKQKAAIGWRPNLSAEKIEESAKKGAEMVEANDVKKSVGLEPDKPAPGADAKWLAQEVVPKNFYYLDEPYTKEHAARLAAILVNAQTTSDRTVQPFLRFDWDRVVAEAASFLSPRQLEGLRGIEAWGRTDTLLGKWTP